MSGSLPFTFHRPALAGQLADALLGKSPFDYRSGLFLAAPRRTGKSTFLRLDLVPELERRGLATLYADLWSDRQRGQKHRRHRAHKEHRSRILVDAMGEEHARKLPEHARQEAEHDPRRIGA